MELVDTHDSKSCELAHVGSIPTDGTILFMKIFFDIIIYGTLFLTALLAVILLFHTKKDLKSWEYNHKKFSFSLIFILTVSFFLIFWGSFIEPKILLIKKEKIDLVNFDQKIKIVYITDLHIGAYKKDDYLSFLVKTIIKEKPNLVLIGGDTVDNGYIEEEIKLLHPFKKLTDVIPVYAISGNHEYGVGYENGELTKRLTSTDKLKEFLEKINITYLENDLFEIEIKGQGFYLFGADEFWADKTDFSVLEKREKNIPTIAIIHNPAILLTNYYPDNIDLSLFGHTHGGQIRLPFLGPIGRVDNILPKEMYKGYLQNKDNNKIFVSSGAGETGIRSRLFNPPELVIFEIE